MKGFICALSSIVAIALFGGVGAYFISFDKNWLTVLVYVLSIVTIIMVHYVIYLNVTMPRGKKK